MDAPQILAIWLVYLKTQSICFVLVSRLDWSQLVYMVLNCYFSCKVGILYDVMVYTEILHITHFSNAS